MLLLRDAVITDTPAIKQLLHETWIDTYSPSVPIPVLEEVMAAWHDPAKLAQEIASKDVQWFVAELPGEPLAGVLSATQNELVLHLGRLYVRPNAQRLGVGEALLEALVESHPEAVLLQLEVEEKNPKGRAFYRKHGFRELRRVRQDLGSVEAYVFEMERFL